MRLFQKPDTIAKIDWRNKSINLKELSNSLNLSLDTFLFIDDNPLEIETIKKTLPEVKTILWQNKESIVKNLWPLDKLSETAEDQQRTQQYADETKRYEHKKSFVDQKSFLKSLGIHLEISPLVNIERASQLLFRVNQFRINDLRLQTHTLEKTLSKRITLPLKFH